MVAVLLIGNISMTAVVVTKEVAVAPTDVVLYIADVEGGCGHGHAQAVFLLNQDWLIEAVLLQVVHGQLAATELDHHIISTGRHVWRTCVFKQNSKRFLQTTEINSDIVDVSSIENSRASAPNRRNMSETLRCN